MVKRPSFQFYPGDWLNDASLRMVSVGARGLWIEMLCIMHQGYPYGWLKVGGKVILTANLTRMVGATLPEVEGWLAELEGVGVFSRDADGCIYSRRMIRDENTRLSRAAGGILGGNPKLKQSGKDNHKDNHKVGGKVILTANLQPTPSSSSSSSSSNNNTLADKPPVSKPREKFQKPTIEEIREYCVIRNNSVDPERFHAYYESNGWRVGKNPMKDWKATVITWEKNNQSQDASKPKPPTTDDLYPEFKPNPKAIAMIKKLQDSQ